MLNLKKKTLAIIAAATVIVVGTLGGLAASGTFSNGVKPLSIYNVISPPTTIDATCSTDVTAQMEAWLQTVPNGTSSDPTDVVFPAGACYLVNGTLWLRGARHITYSGGEFVQQTPTAGLTNVQDNPNVYPECGKTTYEDSSYSEPQNAVVTWWFDGGCDITLENMTLVGPDTTGAGGGVNQVDSFIVFNGTQNELVDNVTGSGPYGDFVDIGQFHDCGNCAAGYEGTDLTVENSNFKDAGRVGIGIIRSVRTTIENNTFQSAALTMFDVEIDCTTCTSYDGLQNDILIQNNTVVGAGNGVNNYGQLLAAITAGSVNRLQFTGNRMTQGAQMRIDLQPQFPDSDIRIDNNTASQPNSAGGATEGTAIYSTHTGTMEIDDNTIPLGTGVLDTVYPPTAPLTVCQNNGSTSPACPSPSPITPPTVAVLPS